MLWVDNNCSTINASNNSFTFPASITVELEKLSTMKYVVQDIMELAADENPQYQFTVTYYNRSTGYIIDILSDIAVAEDCQWLLFYQPMGQSEFVYKMEGISFFVVEPNSTVALSYQPPPSDTPLPTPVPTPDDDDDSALPTAAQHLLATWFCLTVMALAIL